MHIQNQESPVSLAGSSTPVHEKYYPATFKWIPAPRQHQMPQLLQHVNKFCRNQILRYFIQMSRNVSIVCSTIDLEDWIWRAV